MPVKILTGTDEQQSTSITVRPLYVDTKLKEYTTGSPHDVTDRLYVVRRAYRVNDNLPDEPAGQIRWIWQRGGWILVDRVSGHITAVKLPDFDASSSEVSWYRDYAAYCGIPDGKDQLLAVVAQIGSRKAVFRKDLGKAHAGEEPSPPCAAPHWERKPARVTFVPGSGDKFTVNVKTRQVDEPVDNSEDE